MPGVGALYVAAGTDLHQYLGVPLDSPTMEEARQTVLKACKNHNVVCGISATTQAEADKRIKEGWKMIKVGGRGSDWPVVRTNIVKQHNDHF